MEPVLLALVVHGAIGGLDVLINHQLRARVPSLPNAGPEQVLHGVRELVFALLFIGLGWFAWHGVAALCIAALLATELVITTVDTVIEFDTRLLPPSERVAHVLLLVNFGIILALLGPVLLAWSALPSAIVSANYGALSWLLTVLGLGALGWSARDGLAAARLKAAAAT